MGKFTFCCLCLLSIISVNLIGRASCVSECPAGWTLGTHTYLYCYRLSSVRMTYTQAGAECRKFDSYLLRIYTDPTWQEVQSFMNKTPDTRWWTGLNDYGAVGDWVYGTGANKVMPDMSMVKFLSKPDDSNHMENCGALTYQGTVSDERCGDKHRYICEYTKPSDTVDDKRCDDNRRYICEYTKPSDRPCAQSWMNYTGGCYLFPFGLADPFSELTWAQAKNKCQNVLAGTPDSNIQPHLLFIETQDELSYVRSTLPQVTQTAEIWWIGMTDAASEGMFKWTDGTPVNNQIIVWVMEPNNLGGTEVCGYINRMGKFGDLDCGSKEAYICQKEVPDDNEYPAMGCPGSWTRGGGSCYLMEYTNTKTWQDANTACQQAGANLISIDDTDEGMWLEGQTVQFKDGYTFWTGLNNLGGSTWQWTNGRSADMSLVRWTTEPNNFKGSEDCATLTKLGFLNDVDCLTAYGFICEMNEEDMGCPAGWLTYDTGDQLNCYYISNTTATRDEAFAQCNTLAFPANAYMTAYNNKAELTFLQKSVKAQPGAIWEWFTGLTDSGHEGFWGFDTTFNPAPDASLMPWGSWPTIGDGNCVAVALGAQYMNLKCTNKLAYICEKQAQGVASRGSRILQTKFSASSVFVIMMYFLAYGICLHYILHLTYVLSPSYAYV